MPNPSATVTPPNSDAISASHMAYLIGQCSIARASHVMGDAWTLLVLRELFWGRTRYEQLAQQTGIASNILADRLRKLIEHGIVTRSVVPEDARRFDYALSEKGLELFPVLMAVMAWGDKWSSGDDGPLITLKHRVCGKKTKPGNVCSACGNKLLPEDIITTLAPTYRKPVAAVADAAEQDFINRSKGGVPDEIDEITLPLGEGGAALGIGALLKMANLAASSGEGNRLIDGGGVRIDSNVVIDKGLKLGAGVYVLQVGKRKFAKVTLS